MFVEKTAMAYVRCDRPTYVPPKCLVISGSRATSCLNERAMVWGLTIHEVTGDYVEGVRRIPAMVADRLSGLESLRKDLEAKIKILQAEEMQVLELAYHHGDLVTVAQVKALEQAAGKKAVAS